jgi:hypothetical protein
LGRGGQREGKWGFLFISFLNIRNNNNNNNNNDKIKKIPNFQGKVEGGRIERERSAPYKVSLCMKKKK